MSPKSPYHIIHHRFRYTILLVCSGYSRYILHVHAPYTCSIHAPYTCSTSTTSVVQGTHPCMMLAPGSKRWHITPPRHCRHRNTCACDHWERTTALRHFSGSNVRNIKIVSAADTVTSTHTHTHAHDMCMHCTTHTHAHHEHTALLSLPCPASTSCLSQGPTDLKVTHPRSHIPGHTSQVTHHRSHITAPCLPSTRHIHHLPQYYHAPQLSLRPEHALTCIAPIYVEPCMSTFPSFNHVGPSYAHVRIHIGAHVMVS